MRALDVGEFSALAMRAPTVFDEPAFATLNANRADRLVHLVLGEPAVRFGLVAGVRGGRLCAPFSAPWSLPLLGKARPRIRDFQLAAEDLMSGVAKLGVEGVDMVLPASHLAPDTVAKWSMALMLAGCRTLTPDVSFHIDLTSGEASLDPKARQKLAAARKHTTSFYRAADNDGCVLAYSLIAANRAAHGYPLHMARDDLLAMRSLLPVDFLILQDQSVPAAAAICYRLSPHLAYVVYWGDSPDSTVPHTMNLLAAEVVSHYAEDGCRVLDTGTASIAGEPQQGLADFKQSIGGIAGLRARFTFP